MLPTLVDTGGRFFRGKACHSGYMCCLSVVCFVQLPPSGRLRVRAGRLCVCAVTPQHLGATFRDVGLRACEGAKGSICCCAQAAPSATQRSCQFRMRAAAWLVFFSPSRRGSRPFSIATRNAVVLASPIIMVVCVGGALL
ncbi:unnamed protein product [Scytosiphon promiscuus]